MTNRPKDVETYLQRAPEEIQSKLREVRSAIREAAPETVESISYGMPYYGFKEESGFHSRLCYFGLRGKKEIAFYTRPVFLEEYMDEVKAYMTAKSALQFSLDRPVPARLIKKLVRSAIRKHEAGKDNPGPRRGNT